MRHGFLEKVYEPRPLVMTEAEKAWLACAIDAEGSIMFQTYQTPKSKYRRWRVGVRIGNTSLKFLREAKRIALYGEIHKTYEARKRHKAYYYLNISEEGCRYILPKILPYLIIKREKAEIALMVLDLLAARLGRGKKRALIQQTNALLEALLIKFISVEEGNER